MADEELTLRQELQKNFKGDETTEQVVEETTEKAAPVEETKEVKEVQKGKDEKVRVAKKEEAKETKKETKQEAVQEVKEEVKEEVAKPVETTEVKEITEQVDLPPSTWTAQAKAEYNKLPEVIRQEVKKRETDMQKGILQYKQAAENGSRVLNEIQPYLPLIQSEGGTPELAIKQLLNTAYRLRTGTAQERGQIVMQIAQQYGADLSQFTGEQETDPQVAQIETLVNKALQPRLQELDQVKTTLLTSQQQKQQEEQTEAQNQIEAFQNATDEKGNPKHIYFDNVRAIMSSLWDSGTANTLEQAYEMACRAHPEVSVTLSSEQKKSEDAQRLEEARQKAKDAKQAKIANAEGEGSAGDGAQERTLREELQANFRGARI